MTREESVKLLTIAKAEIEWEYPLDYQVALDMAIKALEAEPCEDAISRRAVLDLLITEYNKWTFADDAMEACVNKVRDELPSVTPTRPKGKWECQSNEDTDTWYCNVCHKQGCQVPKGCTPNIIFDNYCSYCGSYMKGGEEDEIGN